MSKGIIGKEVFSDEPFTQSDHQFKLDTSHANFSEIEQIVQQDFEAKADISETVREYLIDAHVIPLAE